MIKKMKWIVIYLVLILIILNSINAATYPVIIPYVNDFGHLMTADQVKSLDDHCAKIDLDTTYEIVVVSLNSTNGDDPTDYANHIGQQNGVGKATTDNGVVILWDIQDKKGGIAIGRGAETYLNDAKVGEIGRNARHFFDEGKYYEGFNQIVSDIETTIHQRDTSVNSTSTIKSNSSRDNGLLTAFIIILIFGVIAYLILSKAGVIPRIGGSAFSFRGGGGGGGRSFGGGSFGGGGASFTWI